jgi:deoxyribodipyrimidine photolyase-related protein
MNRMSDYCKGCAYDPQKKTGEDACPFNALYWDFFDRHAETFDGNRRLSMVYHQLNKMPDEQRKALRDQAKHLREHIETL